MTRGLEKARKIAGMAFLSVTLPISGEVKRRYQNICQKNEEHRTDYDNKFKEFVEFLQTLPDQAKFEPEMASEISNEG